MADTKISAVAALGGNPASLDRIPLVDVSDTSMAASGTTKYALASEVYAGALASNANISAIAALADPNADRLMFWDDSAGAIAYMTAGTGLVITDTTIAADIGTSGAKIPLLNGANTWSGQNIFALGTITTSQPFTISSTLNAAGVTFEGLLIDWTDTASAAGSLPINVKVGGSSIFNISKTGKVYATGGASASAPDYSFAGDTNTGIYQVAADNLGISVGGAVKINWSTSTAVSYVPLAFNNGNTINGAMRNVEASTSGSGAPNVLTNSKSWRVLTNEGTTAENYHTLPSAAPGYVFTFCVQDADGLRVTAATGDTIRVRDKVTATAGYLSSTTIGAVVTLVAINSTEWFALDIGGVWTDGTFTYDDTSLTTP